MRKAVFETGSVVKLWVPAQVLVRVLIELQIRYRVFLEEKGNSPIISSFLNPL
jgi:hypothetical protein